MSVLFGNCAAMTEVSQDVEAAQLMGWAEYKAMCDMPGVTSRWMLEQTAELLPDDEVELSSRLLSVVRNCRPLPKPEGHRGGADTDMFRLQLSVAEVQRICACVDAAADTGRSTQRTRRRGLGGFSAAWHEHRRAMESNIVIGAMSNEPGDTGC